MKVFFSPGALLVVAGAFRVAEAGELTSFEVVSVVVKEGVVDGPRSKSSS